MDNRQQQKLAILGERPAGTVRLVPRCRVAQTIRASRFGSKTPVLPNAGQRPLVDVGHVVHGRKDTPWGSPWDDAPDAGPGLQRRFYGSSELPLYPDNSPAGVPDYPAIFGQMLDLFEKIMGRGSSGLSNYGIPMRDRGGWVGSFDADTTPTQEVVHDAKALEDLQQAERDAQDKEMERQEAAAEMDRNDRKILEDVIDKFQGGQHDNVVGGERGDVGRLPIPYRRLLRQASNWMDVVFRKHSPDPGWVDPARPVAVGDALPSTNVSGYSSEKITASAGPTLVILRQHGHDVIDFDPHHEPASGKSSVAPLRRFILPDPL